MIPRSIDDLQRRHRGSCASPRRSVGLMGRTPDYMNVTFAGFAGERSAWLGPDGGNEEGARQPRAFQKQLRARRHLADAHHRAPDRRPGDRQVVRRTTRCRCTRSATPSTASSCAAPASWPRSRPFADEIAVYPGHPLPPDAPPEYALSFSIPMDTPGLIFLCRDSASTPGAEPVRPPALDPLRRAGRVRDLRRRRGARASACSSTATSTSTTR